jgi:hypothetical protein
MKRLFAATNFVVAVGLLLAIGACAAVADDAKISSAGEIVVPDSIYGRQPFSFAVTRRASVQGEVISIETADGVVVQNATADKYGRVFLAAGLPAGAYLISGSDGRAVGKVAIQTRAADIEQQAGGKPSQPIQLQNPPQVLKLSDPFSLSGHGFSPNFADMQVSIAGSGKTEAPIVLAATEDQLKLAPVQQLQPSAAQLRVTNQGTRQSTDSYDLLLYSIDADLVRRTIRSGNDETQLVITVQPRNLALNVRVSVVSGPVDFGGGRKQAEGITRNGEAVFPVHAENGAGLFQLTWELALNSMRR